MSSIPINLFWNSLNTIGRLGIGFITTIVLARLLTPDDFGIWGLMAIFISISELLSDSGMGGYLIKKRIIAQIDYNTLFVYNLTISIALYAVIFFTAPLIADYYNNFEIIAAIRVASLAILFQAIGITPTNKLLKELRFKQLAIVSLTSGILSLILASIFAFYHLGYWALITQHIAATLFASLGAYAFSKHIPHFEFRYSVFKEQFKFGINLMTSSLLNSLSTNVGNNVIGKYFNLSLTGLYVQASKLQGMSTSVISSIVDKTFFPHFSRINDQVELIQEKGRELSRRMFAYCFPLFLIVVFFAKEIVNIVLGAQWINSASMLQVLMIASFPALGKSMNRNILKSMGYTHEIFMTELYSTVFLLLGLGYAIYLKSFWLILILFVLSQFVAFILSAVYLHKKIGFGLKVIWIDFAMFIPLVVIPLIAGAIFGLSFRTFACSFLPILALYSLVGVKEYRFYTKQL